MPAQENQQEVIFSTDEQVCLKIMELKAENYIPVIQISDSAVSLIVYGEHFKVRVSQPLSIYSLTCK